tara:strand:+ start:2436 stop:3386 length:951 start_codon:yes stop_codon:yes gene_type:complete
MKQFNMLWIFIGISILLAIATPEFLTAENLLNITRQSAVIGLIAVGTTFVIIGGGFDISVGSLLALSSAICISLQTQIPWPLAAVVTIGVGMIVGTINGLLSVKIGIPSIIATLAMMTILRGTVYLFTGGYPVVYDHHGSWYPLIGQGSVAGIPVAAMVLLGSVIIAQWVLVKTRFGRYTCAIGGNKEASRYSGIAVDFHQIATFVIGGALAALAGVVYGSRLLSVSPLAGQGYELDAIAATVIGGTSVSGGEGSVIRTLIGVLLLSIIGNVFNLLGLQVYIQYVIKGLIILFAVGIDTWSKKQSESGYVAVSNRN